SLIRVESNLADNEHASNSWRATTGAARSLTHSDRHRAPSTLQDVHARRIATGAISVFARTKRRRRNSFARTLGKPNLPCRPPRPLIVGCFYLPGVRVQVGAVGNAGADLEPAVRPSWLTNNARA